MPTFEVIDERDWVSDFRRENMNGFYEWVEAYDKQMAQVMKKEGWVHSTTDNRTVVFTFGEVSFKRRGYKKNGETIYPVDRRLGLIKGGRHSKELLFQVAKLSKMLVYRAIPGVIEMMYGVHITKDTVTKAIKMTAELFNERDEYRYYEENEETEKIKADVLYLEGDGVHIRTTFGERFWTDMAHILIHTGSKVVSAGKHERRELQNKKEFVSASRENAIEQMVDFITNQYEITENTLLISNSDMGTGYVANVFKEIARILNIKKHEHFYDEYHLNADIKKFFRGHSEELKNDMFEAIRINSKKRATLILDTAESRITDNQKREDFHKYRNKVLRNFQYTKPARLRGLSHKGIGVMETQHKVITYRMKHRGMYWGLLGLETMSRMLVLRNDAELRELFFGNWREEYEKFKNLPETLSPYLKRVESDYEAPSGTVHLPGNKRMW
jgi:Uncharacterised protein family (UPF0236).